MHSLILLVLSFLLLATPASASWFCLYPKNADLSVTAPCTKVVTTTNGLPNTVLRCANSGTPGFYFNSVVPPAMPDAMDFTTWKVTWKNGTATTGNGCWNMTAQVFKDGQDWEDGTFPSTLLSTGPTAIPSSTNVKIETYVEVSDLRDTADANCDAAPTLCRLAPIRFYWNRLNTTCTSTADGDLDWIMACYEY